MLAGEDMGDRGSLVGMSEELTVRLMQCHVHHEEPSGRRHSMLDGTADAQALCSGKDSSWLLE